MHKGLVCAILMSKLNDQSLELELLNGHIPGIFISHNRISPCTHNASILTILLLKIQTFFQGCLYAPFPPNTEAYGTSLCRFLLSAPAVCQLYPEFPLLSP